MTETPTRISFAFDFPHEHPRAQYLRACRDELERATGGRCTIDDNPGGRIFAGSDVIEPVMAGAIDIGFMNAAHLERCHPALAVGNLPFELSDDRLSQDWQRAAYVDFVNSFLAPSGIEVVALMRGADQFLASKSRVIGSLSDLAGRTVRVAGPGLYEAIMSSLGAKPVVIPISETEGERADIVFTSPGGWQTLFAEGYPFVTRVSGLMMITYVAIMRRVSDPTGPLRRLRDVLRRCITDQWQSMFEQDAELVGRIEPDRFHDITGKDQQPWQRATESVARAFDRECPDIRKTLDRHLSACS